MLRLRDAWLLTALLLLGSAISVHCLDHVQPEETSATSHEYLVASLGSYVHKSLEAWERVRPYVFGGLGDDVKPSEWPELKPGWRVNSAVILLFIGAAICSAGGIGGGGLFIPVFNLLLLFDPKTSAALSNFVILGGSVANLIWNLPQRHPSLPHKSAIDYDVALILQPNMLLGISIGVICNVMFPGWLIIVQLALILGFITTRSWKNGIKRWRIESQLAALKSENGEDTMERGEEGAEKQNLIRALSGTQLHLSPLCLKFTIIYDSIIIKFVRKCVLTVSVPYPHAYAAEEANAESEGPLESDNLHAPLLAPVKTPLEPSCLGSKVMCLGLVWVAFFVIQLLRGGKTTEV